MSPIDIWEAAIDVGEWLPHEARPFFLSWFRSGMDPQLLDSIGRALGVKELPPAAAIWDAMGAAAKRGDAEAFDALQLELDAAGAGFIAYAALPAIRRFSRTLLQLHLADVQPAGAVC